MCRCGDYLHLGNIFACYGVPKENVHNNGKNFTAQLMKEVLGMMGIQQIRTSPCHTEANGAIERMHGTRNRTLKKAGRTWDKWLPYILYVMRTTEHEASGHSITHHFKSCLVVDQAPPSAASEENVGGPCQGPATSC